jgi:endo-1,4-beta-xylanase
MKYYYTFGSMTTIGHIFDRQVLLSILIIELFFLFTNPIFSQDSYHTNLQAQLQIEYELPAGKWVLNDTENGNLAADFSYGNLDREDMDATDQDFTKKVIIDVTHVEGNQWDTGYGINNVHPVNASDVCLLVFWAKANMQGKVSLSIQNSTTYESEYYLTMPMGNEWSQFFIPFETSDDYGIGGLQFVFQLNWLDQQIEIGGMATINYRQEVAMDHLPVDFNNEFYPGYHPDAPWRAEAAQRIEEIRKADLKLEVLGTDGFPMEGAEVNVRMIEHDFGFGTAVAAHLFAGNSQQNNTYEARLLDLDGRGHRFNDIVFENATKWKAWEDNWWGVDQQDKVRTLQWLNERGFRVRGHTLIWPSWTNLPNDIQNNQDDPEYIKNRVLGHVEDILTYPGMQDAFTDWDVLNEISVLNDLANALKGSPGYPTGREIYVDIMEKFREFDPNGKAYINDYTVFGAGRTATGAEDLKTYIQEIINAGQPVDGIGFQGHIGIFPTGIPELYDILEDFHTTFGTQSKITEFDFKPGVDDALAAKYLVDFYTMCFSHPSVSSILMWGFWDGAHWYDNAPLFREDWSLKPSGEAFFDLVFDKWWTVESDQTNAEGSYSLRGFKGKYEISIDCGNGNTIIDTIELLTDRTFSVDCALVNNNSLISDINLQVYPNPTRSELHIEWAGNNSANIEFFDLLGQKQLSVNAISSPARLDLTLPSGIYIMVLETNDHKWMRKVLVD